MEANLTNEPNNVDIETIKKAVRQILIAVGEDPDRDGLKDAAAGRSHVRRDVFRIELRPRTAPQSRLS